MVFYSKQNFAPIECNSKCNATHSGMSLKMECHSNGMSPSNKCRSKLNVTENRKSINIERCLKRIVTKNEMSLKMEFLSK